MDSQDLAFAGIAAQAELLRAGEVSPRELLDVYLERIDRIDPRVRAFRVVFHDRARAEAEQAEARLRAGDTRPLLGVPVAIKDSVDMAGEVSTHGSLAFDEPATGDADVVQRLRAAGAVIVGRTHMPELAIFPFTESQAFGATQNPWKEGHSPGGSSGGSGAAVAAGLIGAAYASDGGGSIRIPAACGGLFGLKPQRGRVSLAPAGDHWHGLSVAGCVSRGVADTALWLDSVAAEPPERPFAESARTAPGKLRIALSMRPIATPVKIHPEVRAAIDRMAETLRSLGHEVSRQDVDYGTIFPSFVARWLRGISDDAREAPRRELLERRTRELAWAGRRISDGLLARTRAAERGQASRINAIFEQDGHDVVLTPLTPQPPDPIGRYSGRGALTTTIPVGDMTAYTTPWNAIGQPAASVPAGFTQDGLPLAVQLVGRPSDEATLISLAAQIEAETQWTERRPPEASGKNG
ncbi:MAG: amidase [Thermoleophilaceae bacterium]